MPAARAASSAVADQAAPVALVGERRIDGERPEQQRAAPAADADRREAHGGDELPVDRADAAEGREPARALAQPVGGAREAAGPEGARVQGGDLGAARPADRLDMIDRLAA